jgi:uracil-DNA glycosylase
MDGHKEVQLEPGWLEQLAPEFDLPYMVSLRDFLVAEKAAGKVIYPAGSEYFNALNSTPFESVKVVILGQDPYHGPNQAHGLCFSVRQGVPLPPSLKNVYKEIQSDLGFSNNEFSHGCLEGWASQGVLLLNSVLTVEQNQAASHQGKGWETFTDRVIECLSRREKPCVFLLWGNYAQKKGVVIDRVKHQVLTAPHPSPLSAHRGFLGCKHFSQCNSLLEGLGETAIDWHV